MKNIYRIVMSKGGDFVFEESVVRKIMDSDIQMLEIPKGNGSIWINKAHIVFVCLDKEETAIEKQKDFKPNLPAPEETISIDRIRQLREKAQELATNKHI